MKRWYVVQVYAGYEDKVRTDLIKRLSDEEMQEHVGQISIPSVKMKNFFNALEEKSESLFPGYVLIEMEIVPGIVRLVSSTPRVLKFLGGKDPVPLRPKEVARILSQVSGKVVVAAEKGEFAVGDEVDINEGPFAGFVGIIDHMDENSDKLTVMVSIFGRMTPVELSFNQIKQ